MAYSVIGKSTALAMSCFFGFGGDGGAGAASQLFGESGMWVHLCTTELVGACDRLFHLCGEKDLRSGPPNPPPLTSARAPGGTQFQLISTDFGKTLKRSPTNIGDIAASTPSLILDPKTGLVSNYYYHRGAGVLRRRVVDPARVFDHPDRWPVSEPITTGSRVTYDAGNANSTVIGDTHYISFYSGKAPDTGVFVSVVPASSP